MAEKGIRSGTGHFINRYAKDHNKYIWKIMTKINNCQILNIGM